MRPKQSLKCNKRSFVSDQHYREIYRHNCITSSTVHQLSYPYWILCCSLPGSYKKLLLKNDSC